MRKILRGTPGVLAARKTVLGTYEWGERRVWDMNSFRYNRGARDGSAREFWMTGRWRKKADISQGNRERTGAQRSGGRKQGRLDER